VIVYTDRDKIPFIIDDDDWEIVKHYSWCIDSDGYPKTKVGFGRVNSTRKPMRLHILLLGKAPEGLEWDHRDKNQLNNRRTNLRAVTHTTNVRNARKQLINASGVNGVTIHHRRAGLQCWKARISVNGHMIYLGLFDTLEAAIEARSKAQSLYWEDV
jgi:hypothetical protein